MAASKYARLIQEGAGTFSKREWAVVHLNQAICHHLQDQLNPALELVRVSLASAIGQSRSTPPTRRPTIDVSRFCET